MGKVETSKLLFSVRGLRKKFLVGTKGTDGFEALSGVDLDIHEGECLLVAGANGSGKTLLMRMLAGLMEPTEGEILFKGKALGECGKLLRRSVGLVFQDADAQILGETVEEDIRFGPENLKLPEGEIEKRLEETLAGLELAEKRGFSSRSLSGGEKRRLAVAGVLAMDARIIIFDEPYANMDYQGVVQVNGLIKKLLAVGKTIILLTHEIEKCLSLADRFIVLFKGKKVFDGGVEEALLQELESWGIHHPLRNPARELKDLLWQ